MRRQVFILALIGFFCFKGHYISGQISEGGTPMSFSLDMGREIIPVMTMSPVDAKALLAEDERTRMEGVQRPFRFGYAMDVDIDVKKAGIKKELPEGGNLWLLKIHCPDALSINLIYDRFKLAEGSKFFIYNEDRTMILGAFTPEVSNNPYNEFATDLVQGNTIVLEYYEPKTSDGGIIKISEVIHGYIDVFGFNSRGLGDAANCNYDANCDVTVLGQNWDNEKKAVCLIIMGGSAGSGCLINNTNQNFTPYILTARHNFFDDNNSGSTPDRNIGTAVFKFHYLRPNCGSGSPANAQSVAGASLRAQHRPTDVLLVELNSKIPTNYNVYFAGWDRSTTGATTATCLHHPSADVMKISQARSTATAVSYIEPLYYWTDVTQNHWRVTFNDGIVQKGSSGSPLFNQNRRIVGQLHGNQDNDCDQNDNTCFCNQTPIGEYGRFDLSWTGGGTNATRLSNWLAPELTNQPQTLEGTYFINKIEGDNYVNPTSGASYKLNSDASVLSWSISNLQSGNVFKITSSNSVSATVSATPQNDGKSYSATIYATISGETISKTITMSAVIGSAFLCPTANYFINTGEIPLYWGVTSGFDLTTTNGGASAIVTASAPNLTGTVTAYFLAKTYSVDIVSCEYDVYGSGKSGSYVSIYPNPANDVLSIEIDETLAAQMRSAQLGAQSAKVAPTYNIRLYNIMGNLVRNVKTKDAKVELDVSKLPNGFYFLHVYDGIIPTPEIHKVIITH